MVFEIWGYELSFRKKQFYLVTGFSFRDYFLVSGSGVAAFHSRMFLRVLTIKLEDVSKVFEHSLNDLLDEDAVHVCLLYLLEKGSNGRLAKQLVFREYLALVSDVDEFNKFLVVHLI